MQKITIIIFFFIMVFSCSEKTVKEENNQSGVFLVSDHINEVVSLIDENAERINFNELKGIEALGLLDKQESFYKERINYFKAVFKGEEEKYNINHRYWTEYYDLFPADQKGCFFSSRNGIDFRIMHLLESEYPKIVFPVDFIIEFFR